MSLHEVVVTGVGAICGLGHNLSEIWPALLEGQSGISSLSGEAMQDSAVKIAGVVKDFEISDELLAPKEKARFDLFIHYALHAASEAINEAQLMDGKYDPYQMGCILGTGLGGFPYIEETYQNFLNKGARRISPFFIPSFIPNMSAGKIAMHFNLRGINHAVSSACASGAHALAAAATEIMMGRCDAMITGGSEAVVTTFTLGGFNSMKALSRDNENPTSASRPFDLNRSGFVMGEGAGILVLENKAKAIARGAKILAEIVGFGATDDAYHVTAPHPEGEGTIPCMQQALNMAKITHDQIDYINAHGTSTPLGDIAETKAIKSLFKDHAHKLSISSTKSMTGHLLGAAGGLESVFCVKALSTGIIPPTANLETPDPECDLNYTPLKGKKIDPQYILNNSFGFGGTNSTTIFKKH